MNVFPDDDLRALVQQPAPRELCGAMRERVRGARDGRVAAFAALFFGLGVVFTLVAMPDRPLAAVRMQFATLSRSQATVDRVEPTLFAFGERDSGSRLHVVRLRYSFELDGRDYQGVGYSSDARWRAGDDAAVLYLPSDPSVSRLLRANAAPLGWISALPLVFPLLGVWILLLPWIVYRGRLRLVRDGRHAMAEVLSVQQTPYELGGQRAFRVEVRFEVDGRKVRASVRCYGADVEAARWCLENGERVDLVHDPVRLRRILLCT